MRRRALLATTALLLVLPAGCTASGDGSAPVPTASVSPTGPGSDAADSPTTGPASPEAAASRRTTRSPSGLSTRPTPAGLDDWDIGAQVLPLRPDGYGRRRPTPRELRVRRMPTVDVLPPPARDRYTASIHRIGPRIHRRMGTSWEPGCPVPLRDLRYVRVAFVGFDGLPHTGELIVHEDHARGIVRVFRKLYAARFPIEQMTLPTSAGRDPTPSGDGNGTAAMVCRATTGQTFWSAHASGLAIDVNPFQNPYLRGDLLLPELAGAYLDRDWRRPGMIAPGGVVVRAFAAIGWSWGGSWRSLKDYQHFSATGR